MVLILAAVSEDGRAGGTVGGGREKVNSESSHHRRSLNAVCTIVSYTPILEQCSLSTCMHVVTGLAKITLIDATRNYLSAINRLYEQSTRKGKCICEGVRIQIKLD